MGQTHPKPETHTKSNSDKSKSNSYLFTNLPPVPRTYTDDFWKRGDDDCRFSDRDIEALNQFRQLELELLKSDAEKESKIREFCEKYRYALIPLDVDKNGYARGFHILESMSYDIYGNELERYGETLILCIGIEYSNAQMYLSGSGKLYISLNYDPLKFLYNYKDTGARSTDVFQNTDY
ncbi:hypothetical protein RclHR1_06020002 [Rhizophagus clarus]|uniref:Uncharacterized protein n=1 Tax=Rhizophagus clarus TaxID=94130 RepID=A0A2Z6SH93_9GLOM|nr:hypothetical protein RclHR1_06020002 [Rhizophagus clarus]GET04009.1 hypothetical protein GLOIN_2v1470696 [Rhizophagus clarus]